MLIKNKIDKQIEKYKSKHSLKKQSKLEQISMGQSKKFVLMFHHIVDNMEDAYNPDFSISTNAFKTLIEDLSKLTDFISLDDVLDSTIEKGVFLTFDDAFESVYNIAFPILKEKNIDFAVFQTIEKLDKSLWLKKEQLIELSKYPGCTVGAHTVSHPHLSSLSANKSKMEIIGGGMLLSEIIGADIGVIAYPYGSCEDVGRREIGYAKQEYTMAFSTLQCCVPKNGDRYFVPRLNVCEASAKYILEMIGE